MSILLLVAVAAASPADGKTMANDDWQQLAIYGVGGENAGPLYLQVHAGDLDGDGLSDDAVLKLQCSGSRLEGAALSPRQALGSTPSGKRQHAPVTVVKEWGAATPQLMKLKPTYDVKTVKGARTAADGWTELALSNAEDLCGAATAVIKTKTKSNQSND